MFLLYLIPDKLRIFNVGLGMSSSFLIPVLCVVFVYALGILLAPFPYWRTYLLLWKTTLCSPSTRHAKQKQAFFLTRVLVTAPFSTFFWYLDEILYPAYRQRTIHPVFIIGMPRCRTTFLHRTLAADEHNFFAVRHIEWRYPFISLQKLIKFLGLDNNLKKLNYWSKSEAGKLAAKMHPNTLADWEEDGIFFEENFLHHFFIFLRFPYPDLISHLDSFPELPQSVQQKMLLSYRKVLQKILYLRGPESRYFVSKEVTSHKKIPALIQMFPEARFILIARPANYFMPSLLALVRMSTLSKTGIDPLTLPGWSDRIVERMREDSNRLVYLCKEVIPADKLVLVSSEIFSKNPDIAVLSIYHVLGLHPENKFVAYLEHLKMLQKSRQRGYDYNLVQFEGFEEYDTFVQEISAHIEANLSSLKSKVTLPPFNEHQQVPRERVKRWLRNTNLRIRRSLASR